MGAFLFLSTFSFNAEFTVSRIPRRIGVAFFYSLVMIIGLCFLSPVVKESVFLSTLLIGISKLSSSTLFQLFSKRILPNCLYGDIIFLSLNSVNCSWHDRSICFIWCFNSSYNRQYRESNWY